MEDSNEISDRLKGLESPFTWEMDAIEEVIKNHEESKSHDDEQYVPLLEWMRFLVQAFEDTVKKKLSEANDCIKSAEEIWDSVKSKHGNAISLEVLENILKATKCNVLLKDGHPEEIEQILDSMNEINYEENAKARSTLNGCKSICWSKYKATGNLGLKNAIDFAEEAIKDDPEFDAWHFMLGKNLRRLRRLNNNVSFPTDEEEVAFQKAYELSKEPIYGTFFAQVHKEKRNRLKALSIYKNIHLSKPESSSIRLRLALGFIRLKEFKLAKECLDFAEERIPDDSMFLHYKGIYLESTRKFKEAAEYFLKASRDSNYGAEISYLKCQSKMRVKYNFVEHLEKMLVKYDSFEGRQVDILLQLAACYYMYNKDFSNAAKHYVQVLRKYPNHEIYKNHECVLGGWTNIYSFLKTDFLRRAFARRDLEPETRQLCEELKKLCEEFDEIERKKLEMGMNRISLS